MANTLSQIKLKKKPTKAYVDEKIFRLDNLIKNESSEERKAAYINYRDFWIGQLTARQNPDTIAEKKAIKEAKAAETAERKRIAAEIKAQGEAIEAKRLAEKEAKLAATLAQIEELKKLLPKKELVEEVEEVDESEPESPTND